MKIGIDARPLQHETQYRGIGRSLEFLLGALKDYLDKTDELVFYLDGGLARPAILDYFPDSRSIILPTARLGRKRYFRSFLSSFRPINPAHGQVDVLLQYDVSFGVPRKVPSVVLFHDIIPLLFHDQEKTRRVKGLRKGKDVLARNMYWRKYLRVLGLYKYATRIIAISESSKQDFLKYMPGVKASVVSVVPLAATGSVGKGKVSKKIQELANQPYLLYVGGIDIRKNVVGLLETFYLLKPKYPKLRLVMVGKEFELKNQLEDMGWFKLLNTNPDFAKDVVIPGFVSSADLFYLYQKAQAFVFPSRYEGFGLPVLEAMSAGCPVIAYDNSSIPEVAGDAALLIKDGQPQAPAVEKLLKNSGLRQELIAKGKKRAAEFSWDKNATKILEVLKDTAEK
jgi:glycosyltransferase involved in cell wall biosynthesis